MTMTTRRHLIGLGVGLLAAPSLITRARAGGHLKHPVSIENFAFSPGTIEMGIGDYVVFTNADGAPHTATADNGFFDTGRLNRGDSTEVRMTEPGEFAYRCAFHPSMRGVIRVT